MGVRNSFYRGVDPSLPDKFFDSARKKLLAASCQITLPDSLHHPVIISKNPGFRALYPARQNEFRFLFNKCKKKYFFHFWLLASARKKLAFARK